MNQIEQDILSLLKSELTTLEKRLYQPQRNELAKAFVQQKRKDNVTLPLKERGKLALLLAEYILGLIREKLKSREKLEEQLAEFQYKYSHAVSRQEGREYILDVAASLGASKWELFKDKQAFRRWFGADAVSERLRKRISKKEYELVFLLSNLSKLGVVALEEARAAEQPRIWKRLDLEELGQELLSYSGDKRVRVYMFRCLARGLRALSLKHRQDSLSQNTITYIYRSALHREEDIWIQIEALELLDVLSSDALARAVHKRLYEPREGDEFFVRGRAARLLGKNVQRFPELEGLLPFVLHDPSAYVRQALAWSLAETGTEYALKQLQRLVLEDESEKVRAYAVCQAGRLLGLEDWALGIFVKVFDSEKDSLVLRTALRCYQEKVCEFAENKDQERAADLFYDVLPAILRLHQYAQSTAVRRWAAQAREKMQIFGQEKSFKVYKELGLQIEKMGKRKSKILPGKIVNQVDDLTLGRILSVLAQDDFGYTIEKRLFKRRLIRGDVHAFRVWRFIYEFLHPSPDKRQAFKHTTGRLARGLLRAPSSVLDELTKTRVPGEPLHINEEAGWRPYLPLPDDVLSSLSMSFLARPMKILSSEGVTEVKPPFWPWQRVWAWLCLTLGFAHYAELRNWTQKSRFAANDYSLRLNRLGFRINYQGYLVSEAKRDEDERVRRFFPFWPAFLEPEIWPRFKEYFFSAYGNSLYELGLFGASLLAVFAGGRLWLSRAVRRARKKLPLVIGGWGTRGKSGTERLKAALFEALGHGLLSKTTGCEAMFLQSFPMGKTREMFLFRPFDKATIWEHHNLMRQAAKGGADVFLWECMGLTPSYVKILQQSWSRDDYSTITNTYPDHEDIQGPAGINIPEVMTNFIPQGKTLITTEERMRPILEQSAREKQTRLVGVDWLDSGLLTEDVLNRFPYQEHPANVALVLELASQLQIEPDFALKEMADRVVPDLGVLKAFPLATQKGRTLEFNNGMSANERIATLGNWQRMGFDDEDRVKEPGVLVSTLVNNRADRVPRSRVFASMLIEDLPADLHVLIGTNLTGLLGYIQEAWEDFIRQSLSRAEEDPALSLKEMGRHLRLPLSQEEVKNRLISMLEVLSPDLDHKALMHNWQQPEQLKADLQEAGLDEAAQALALLMQNWLKCLSEYSDLQESLNSDGQNSRPDRAWFQNFRQWAWKWFEQKLVVIYDEHASGEQIINRLFRETPPGCVNRVMGIQNIKGTGLDFVYRWQAWETCWMACEKLRSTKNELMQEGLDELVAFQEYGILSEEYVLKTLEQARSADAAQTERFQAQISFIEKNLQESLQTVRNSLSKGDSYKGLTNNILLAIEAFLDAGDGVKRRKKANQISKDLLNERISHERAALELKKLNKRQKGGWLIERLRK